jgi:hypothetical protein
MASPIAAPPAAIKTNPVAASTREKVPTIAALTARR